MLCENVFSDNPFHEEKLSHMQANKWMLQITDHELENLLHYRSNMYAPSADVILPQNNMKNIVFTIWIIFKQHLDYNEYYIKT